MNPSCEGFNFVNNVCKILKAEYLYNEGKDLTDVYIKSSLVPGNVFDSILIKPRSYNDLIPNMSSIRFRNISDNEL